MKIRRIRKINIPEWLLYEENRVGAALILLFSPIPIIGYLLALTTIRRDFGFAGVSSTFVLVGNLFNLIWWHNLGWIT